MIRTRPDSRFDSIRLAVMFAACSVLCLLSAHATVAQNAAHRPKYGPQATRLVDAQDYVRQHPAPDFWGLLPYYVSQPDDHSCALASVTMLVNALRVNQSLNANEQLATAEGILDKHDDWRKCLTEDTDGVTLDQLAVLVPPVLQTYGMSDFRVQVHRFDDATGKSLDALRTLLTSNEQSGRNLVIVNVLQSTLTGDPEGAVGHMAPIGAFDASADRVLLFDPDRRWYEPYWVPTAVLLEAMATRDPVSGQARGLLHVSRADTPPDEAP